MTNLERYHEYQRTVGQKRQELEEERTRLLRHLEFFEQSVEGYKLIGDKRMVEQTSQALKVVQGKLAVNERALEGLTIENYAEPAWEELELDRAFLQDEWGDHWERCLKLRAQYLEALKKFPDLRQKSYQLSYKSQPVAKALNRNPLSEIPRGGNRFFDIDASEFF
jgi:hypothetical protein